METPSGGKIVRPRRTLARRTPYDRDRLSTSRRQNPNWISRLMYSPRTIATGTVKLLSSVFGSDSSSSDSSDVESMSEDDMDDNNDGTSVSSSEVEEKNGTSETIKCFMNDPLPAVWKAASKHTIEQLLFKETFSREECDRLISIIESRVVDRHVNVETEHGSLKVGMPDISTEPFIEARNWLEDKKFGSKSKFHLEYGTSNLKAVMLSHGTEGEDNSPVDMAKSYMRTRPPWASPTMKHKEFRDSSSIGMRYFTDDTPCLIGDSSLSSHKYKKETPSSGSWNIQEEIRRVRSKATEELLKDLPSSKIDWSALNIKHKNNPCLVADEFVAGTKAPHGSLNIAGDTSPLFPVSQIMQNEVFPTPAVSSSERNQDVEENWIIKEKGGVQDHTKARTSQRFRSLEDKEVNTVSPRTGGGDADIDCNPKESTQPHAAKGGTTAPVILALDASSVSKLGNRNCSTSKDAVEEGGAHTSNGYPVSASGLWAGLEGDTGPEEESSPISSGYEKLPSNIHVEHSEASVEESRLNEKNGIATGSHDSFSQHQHALSQVITRSNPKRGPSSKTTSPRVEKEKEKEKEKGRIRSIYSRRGRGKGK